LEIEIHSDPMLTNKKYLKIVKLAKNVADFVMILKNCLKTEIMTTELSPLKKRRAAILMRTELSPDKAKIF
jgi:hypothetical protein